MLYFRFSTENLFFSETSCEEMCFPFAKLYSSTVQSVWNPSGLSFAKGFFELLSRSCSTSKDEKSATGLCIISFTQNTRIFDILSYVLEIDLTRAAKSVLWSSSLSLGFRWLPPVLHTRVLIGLEYWLMTQIALSLGSVVQCRSQTQAN